MLQALLANLEVRRTNICGFHNEVLMQWTLFSENCMLYPQASGTMFLLFPCLSYLPTEEMSTDLTPNHSASS
jgi:hypothetical protein